MPRRALSLLLTALALAVLANGAASPASDVADIFLPEDGARPALHAGAFSRPALRSRAAGVADLAVPTLVPSAPRRARHLPDAIRLTRRIIFQLRHARRPNRPRTVAAAPPAPLPPAARPAAPPQALRLRRRALPPRTSRRGPGRARIVGARCARERRVGRACARAGGAADDADGKAAGE